MYVREQVRALAEMRRVLRPGGVAAVTDDDLGTVVISPERPELRLAQACSSAPSRGRRNAPLPRGTCAR